ncbi:sure-like protein [Rhodocollybia butyracea]|uniref:Sure-like protein n=1 Tax=Rhodocollybia butyracea TaxID=206335 RepID=A0A9P5Q5U3_9AGAR|nr:sure-like protein [Rhodocollybia butyracea]
MLSIAVVLLYTGLALAHSTKILLTNDDGWAVAMIRTQNTALLNAGYDVVLSSPAQDESGTGSSTATPTVLNVTCEFDTCPIGAPPEGFNASDPRLNYVNSFPVNAVSYGIQTLAPKFFRRSPDFVVSGPNVGDNLGTSTVDESGTVGAACAASLLGVPSTAFSASGLSHVSYTDLANNDTDTINAEVAAALTVEFVDALLAHGKPYLPHGISINVNYPTPSLTSCASPSDFSFILTRIAPNANVTDVETCGTDHLPGEVEVVATPGCFASVSVMNATTKADVDAATQAFVLRRLTGFLSCLPS